MKRTSAMSPHLLLRRHLAVWTLTAVTAACSQVDDFREWQANDHTHATDVAPTQSGAAAAAAPAPQPNIDDEVVDVWRLRCSRCHGPGGHGNGPEGPMYSTPSLARPEWQATVSDTDLRKVISEGRGRMPSTRLTPQMLDGMVRLVRSVGRGRPTGAMPPGHPPVGGEPHPVALSAAGPVSSSRPIRSAPSAAPVEVPTPSAK